MAQFSNSNPFGNFVDSSPLAASGIGGDISSLFGGQNQFQSATAGPNAAAYQNPNTAAIAQLLQKQTGYNGNSIAGAAGNLGHIDFQNMQAAQLNQANSGQDRTQQMQLAGQLAQTAAGQGPSVASQQLQQGLQQQLMGQASLAASQRGGGANPFLAQRAAQDQASQAMQATNAQAAQQRAAEQLTAQNSLGGLLNNVAGQDINQATTQAQLNQQAAANNQQGALQAEQTTAANRLQGLQMQQQANQFQAQQMQGLTQQNIANAIQYQHDQLQNSQYNNTLNANIAQANTAAAGQTGNQILGGLGSALSAGLGALALSDERAKTHIDRDRLASDMDEFLGSLDAASWDYKQPEAHGEGRHYGVMAQSTERSKAGRTFTLEAPDGSKMLDTRKATGVALAALAHMHKRQEKLEQSLAERALGDE